MPVRPSALTIAPMCYCFLCQQLITPRYLPLCKHCLTGLPWYPPTPTLLLQNKYFALQYTAPIKQWVTQLKFHAKLEYALLLGGLLAHSVATHKIDLPHCLLPLPLHKKRLRNRGFNQSLEITKFLQLFLTLQNFQKIPIDTDTLKKTRHTPAQAQLAGAKRKQNLRHAFTAKPLSTYQHIALVDDIHTTGSTSEAARLALITANPALQVSIWCCAAT